MSDYDWLALWVIGIWLLAVASGYFLGRADEIMRRVRQMEREAEKRRGG